MVKKSKLGKTQINRKVQAGEKQQIHKPWRATKVAMKKYENVIDVLHIVLGKRRANKGYMYDLSHAKGAYMYLSGAGWS